MLFGLSPPAIIVGVSVAEPTSGCGSAGSSIASSCSATFKIARTALRPASGCEAWALTPFATISIQRRPRAATSASRLDGSQQIPASAGPSRPCWAR
jgi:hypothetical protein